MRIGEIIMVHLYNGTVCPLFENNEIDVCAQREIPKVQCLMKNIHYWVRGLYILEIRLKKS